MEPITRRGSGANRPGVNLNETEQKFSVTLGAALVCVGLARTSTLRSLLLAGIGAAIAYRGVTGHCHLYGALGIDTSHVPPEGKSLGDQYPEPAHQLAAKNQIDKDRFDKLKATQVERGRDEATAIEVAAEEVKELRRREGRSKEDDIESLAEQFDHDQSRQSPR